MKARHSDFQVCFQGKMWPRVRADVRPREPTPPSLSLAGAVLRPAVPTRGLAEGRCWVTTEPTGPRTACSRSKSSASGLSPAEGRGPALRTGRQPPARPARRRRESPRQQWAARRASPFFHPAPRAGAPSPEARLLRHIRSGRPSPAGASPPVRGHFVPASFAPTPLTLGSCGAWPACALPAGRQGPGTGRGSEAKEEGLGRCGPSQPVSAPSLRLTGRGEGRGGASGAGRTPQKPPRGRGERRTGAAPPPLLAPAKEGESPGSYPPPRTQKRPPSRPHLPGNSPPPSSAHSLPRPRAAARSPPPRPAARPCGPQSARGPRPGVVKTQPLPRRPPCVATTPGRRRRRGGGGGGGGGGVLLSRPLPSPELAPNVRARWSEATTTVVLPRCAAGAERGPGRSPAPGALGGLGTRPPGASAVSAAQD